VTKRGKKVIGKIIEINDEIIAVDVDGKEEEFSLDRVETIKAAGKTKASKEETKEEPKTRRGAGKDKAEEADGEVKHTRASNGGISVGGRIREVMCADLEITADEVGKVLKKEGIDFRETTLNMIHKDTTVVFSLLKKNKKLK
jgi:hypothetical protein